MDDDPRRPADTGSRSALGAALALSVSEELERGSPRRRWVQVEAVRDEEWLRWLGRFRFVTADLMGMRFGVSVQKARRRLTRLASAGLVSAHRSTVGLKSVYVLAPRGAQLLGYPRRRREPRPEVHRDHELAIVQFVAELELAGGAGVQVLTERDSRRLTAQGPKRYSVAIRDRGDLTDRWPDVVVIAAKATVAIEIEFAPKHTPRLARIVRAYLFSDLDEVRFLVTSPALARRLRAVAAQEERACLPLRMTEPATRVVVDAWSGASAADRDAIRRDAD
jgi:hypothetical protein